MEQLVLDRVSKIYGSGESAVTALADASFVVRAGELIAVVGPSGSGKTTLLAIAGALLQPTSGTVRVGGEALAGLSPQQMAQLRLRKIGFVLQASNLVPFLTARDQLLVISQLAGSGGRAVGDRADTLLKELGIAERRNHYPEQLSGGERQRVAIGRALMNDPELLLADEPTANLDSKRGRAVVELIARQVREHGKAGVMVTHDERMLDLCDRVVRIADGVLREEPRTAVIGG